MTASIVRGGADTRLARERHTAGAVYGEMILQICRDYSGLPDVRSLTIHEIVFFYNGLRRELKEHTSGK